MNLAHGDRNAQGLRRLRGRYIRRAGYLITSANDRSFLDSVRAFVRDWNEASPEFGCGVLRGDLSSAPDPLTDVRPPHLAPFFPAGLREELGSLDPRRVDDLDRWSYLAQLESRWEAGLLELAMRFWSPRNFLLPFGELDHPAIAFVSACAFYEARDGDQHLERFFPSFVIQPRILPYEPGHFPRPSDLSRLDGELEYFRRALFDLVGPDAFAEHERSADAAGWQQAARDAQNGHGDWEEIWYLPIVGGMSVQDLRDAEPRIIEAAKAAGGDSFEYRVRTLRAEGMPQQRIADLLGATIKAVRQAESEESPS